MDLELLDLQTEVNARVQIQAAMHRYAAIGREGMDFADNAKLMEPGAVYRLPSGREVDTKNLHEVVQGNEAKYIRHHITSIDIRFVSADVAHTEALFFGSTEHTFTDHWGRWKDVWRRQNDGRWLIKERTIIVEGQDPKGWTALAYGDECLTNYRDPRFK